MELTQGHPAVSDLLDRRVVDQDDRELGRVWELRGQRQSDGTITVEALLIGWRGLLRRLWGPPEETAGIPWSDVVSLDDDGRIRVRTGAASPRT